MDAQSIAVLLTAATGAVASGVTIYIQLQTFRRLVSSAAVRDAKLDVLHTLVNGQSEKMNALSKSVGVAEGVVIGVEQERAAPMVPAPHAP